MLGTMSMVGGQGLLKGGKYFTIRMFTLAVYQNEHSWDYMILVLVVDNV